MTRDMPATTTLRKLLCYGIPSAELEALLPAGQWQVEEAEDIEALRRLSRQEGLHVLVCHLQRPLELCLDAVEDCLARRVDLKGIALLDADLPAEEAIRQRIGQLFFDYLSYPLQGEIFRYAVGHAWGMGEMLRLCQRQPGETHEGMVGESEVIAALRARLRGDLVGQEGPCAIEGEPGTGKELLAHRLHAVGATAGGPFQAVHLPALTRKELAALFERHLGGPQPADSPRGTLYLDEVTRLPAPFQERLLHWLQEVPAAARPRLLVSSTVPLAEAVEGGQLRADLVRAVAPEVLRLPPLRERVEDIPLLAQHFFHQNCPRRHCRLRGISQLAIDALQAYSWPGNVRELLHRTQRAIALSKGSLLSAEDFGLEGPGRQQPFQSLAAARRYLESHLIRNTLLQTEYNISATARLLGISRVTLYRLIDRYGITMPAGESR